MRGTGHETGLQGVEGGRRGWSLVTKINVAVVCVFVTVVGAVTVYSAYRQKEQVLELAKQQVKDLSTMYFDSLNTMMLTGTMSERGILREKMLRRHNVVDARVIRGQPVRAQFGPGFPEEQPRDGLDQRALAGEAITTVEHTDKGRVVTVLTPFQATGSTRGVNCLQCHQVPSGAVNGAIRISYSLASLDAAAARQLWSEVGANVLLLGLGLVVVNLLLRRWIKRPLGGVLAAIERRTRGEDEVRAPVWAEDELGRLAQAYNRMADHVDEGLAREVSHQQEAAARAQELQEKVQHLLELVNRAAAGDLSGRVAFGGDDAIGGLGAGLQRMIDSLRRLMEERQEAVQDLQRRVDAMLAVVRRAAEGDLTGRLEVEGDDAVAELGRAIQKMVDSLGLLVEQVQRSGIQVTSSATEIAATAKQQEATAAEQAATVNEIVATTTEISATARELVNTMEDVTRVSEATGEAASAGQAGLEQMGQTMHRIVEATQAIASKLEVLSEKAANIGSVVTTITKVADQTNLLSLNAAIEAEKAGEYGQGFAVVATEIRRLADQTAVATWDIEQMVKEMQSAVSAGVMSVEKFRDDVRRSVAEVEGVSRQLAHIIEEVKNLAPRFELVHEGMQSQAQGAEQIKQAIVQLNEAAQQTVESLRQSHTAIERLNEAAHGLQDGVSRFRILRGGEEHWAAAG